MSAAYTHDLKAGALCFASIYLYGRLNLVVLGAGHYDAYLICLFCVYGLVGLYAVAVGAGVAYYGDPVVRWVLMPIPHALACWAAVYRTYGFEGENASAAAWIDYATIVAAMASCIAICATYRRRKSAMPAARTLD